MELNCEMIRQVRKNLDLSQAEMAERLEVSLIAYQRWEQGKTQPRPYSRRQFREQFKEQIEALETKPVLFITSYEERGMRDELQVFIESDLTTRLLSLAFSPYDSYETLRAGVVKILRELDAMNPKDLLPRREALKRIVTIPIISLGLLPERVSSAQHEMILARSAVSIEACYELLRLGQDANDFAVAYRCVEQYISLLKPIIRDSSLYRRDAAKLAAQYAILQTSLAWHVFSNGTDIRSAQDAVELSQIAGDALLILSANSKLARSYFYNKKYASALTSAKSAEFVLEQTHMPLPGCIRGGTYSTLAVMQAKNGIDASTAIRKATEIDPGNEVHAFMEFTRVDAPREAALVYYYQDEPLLSLEALGQLIDLTTLEVKPPQSERGRLANLGVMALSSIKMRDMERAVYSWTNHIEGAKALKSECDFSDALVSCEFMEFIWPKERRIASLRELAIHW